MKKITLLNTSILTTYGTYSYQEITLSEAKKIVKTNEVISAIGHSATADILSNLLKIKIEGNRVEYQQDVGEVALIFKLKSRINEGKVLNKTEIEEIGYDFGILTKLR